jgi:hypothetical protein
MRQAGSQESRLLTIGIDASLKRDFGPEIAWAFRNSLTTLGYAWREVETGNTTQCDIVYSEQCPQKPIQLWIPADRSLWNRARDLRWTGLSTEPRFGIPTPEFSVLEQAGTERIAGSDFLFALYWLAAGLEERHIPKNRHGHLDFSGTAYLRDKVFRHAIGSQIIASLGKALRGLGFARPNDPWPNGKRAAFCCGHDVDYPEVIRWLEPARLLRRQGVRGLDSAIGVATGKKHHWHFLQWTELEQRYGLQSAFYFVPRQGSLWQYAFSTPDPFYNIRDEKFRALFREIAGQGGEIGTHASYWAFRDVEYFRSEKQSLEEVAGVAVAGNRHHYWHLDPKSPEATLMMHECLGFEYDSSLTNERYLGWRRSFCTPFFPFHCGERREIKTLQISTGWMDDHLFGYSAMNSGDPQQLLAELVDTVATQRGCLMVDIHDYVFDGDLFPGWRERYQQLLELVSSRRDFWLATPKEVSRHWTERYLKILNSSFGLNAGVEQRQYFDPPRSERSRDSSPSEQVL